MSKFHVNFEESVDHKSLRCFKDMNLRICDVLQSCVRLFMVAIVSFCASCNIGSMRSLHANCWMVRKPKHVHGATIVL